MQGPKRRGWLGTINNPTMTGSVLMDALATSVKYAICQLERGESGTEHLQIYVEFMHPRMLVGVRQFNALFAKGHWEPRKGTAEQAIAYCSKEETRIAGPWRTGYYYNHSIKDDSN